MVAHAANEIEGFPFCGRDAERVYHETGCFELISTGGYYHSLPGDALRQLIDTAAEVQRAMGFANEKDCQDRCHPNRDRRASITARSPFSLP